MTGRRTQSRALARLLAVVLMGVVVTHGAAQSQFAQDQSPTLGPPTAQSPPAKLPAPEARPVRAVTAQVPPRLVTAEGLPVKPSLSDLVNLSLERNPILQQAVVDVDAAQGRAYQAGLYPNPVFTFSGDELSDRQGPGGILTAQLNQEIVTGHKLSLSRAVAMRDVDLATLTVVRQRYTLLTNVRQGYFEVLAAQRRVETLAELVKLVTAAFEKAEALLKAKQIAELDQLVFRIELNRLRAELDAAQQERRAALGRLAAVVGVPDFPDTPLTGPLEAAIPEYDFDRARAFVLETHPEARSAQVSITRAQLALQRARAEPIPNVTVGTGYTRQNQNKSNDWLLQMSLPVPVFNRNQGNIAAAQAELGRANLEVGRVRNDLTNRLWAAFGQYAAARQRVARYRPQILDDARRSYELTLQRIAQSKEISDILLVLQAQKTVQEANLEYIRALAEMWRGASEIAGLLQEEQWPPPVVRRGKTK